MFIVLSLQDQSGGEVKRHKTLLYVFCSAKLTTEKNESFI